MRWSKLKNEIESRFCDSLKHRVAIHSTRYGNCTCGHAWLTLDKTVIANFCTRAYWNKKLQEEKAKLNSNENSPKENTNRKDQLADYGEMGRQDVYEACWKLLHEISIDQALVSNNPMIQTLAVIDKRVGKKQIQQIDITRLHPLAKKLLQKRIGIEKTF